MHAQLHSSFFILFTVRSEKRLTDAADSALTGEPSPAGDMSTRGTRRPLVHVGLTKGAETWNFPGGAHSRRNQESPRQVEANRELESFLRGVATRAFRIARLSLREDADALDAVQEAMIRLARRYGDRPVEEWPPLFYAILRNCVNDELRGRRSRGSLITWVMRLGGTDSAEDEVAGMSQAPLQPAREFESEQRLRELDLAIRRLPARQREAFLLRSVEELDVKDTARAMGCSEGSVKTHYSRAVHALRDLLGEP